MFDLDCARFYIRSPDEMASLGHCFGSTFVTPFLRNNTENLGGVIGLYGAIDSGKTTFCLAFPDALGTFVSDVVREAAFDLFERREPDLRYRYADIGYKTYPDSSRWPSKKDQFPVRLKLNLIEHEFEKTHRLSIRKQAGDPGVDVIEHPSIPYVLRADAVVSISSTEEYKDNLRYFARIMRATKKALCAPKDTSVYPYSIWNMAQMERAQRFYRSDLPGLLRATTQWMDRGGKGRIVQISFLNQEPSGPVREATHAFLSQAMQLG